MKPRQKFKVGDKARVYASGRIIVVNGVRRDPDSEYPYYREEGADRWWRWDELGTVRAGRKRK